MNFRRQTSQYLTRFYASARTSLQDLLLPTQSPAERILPAAPVEYRPRRQYIAPISPRVTSLGTAVAVAALLGSALIYDQYRVPSRDYAAINRPSTTARMILGGIKAMETGTGAVAKRVRNIVPDVTTGDIAEVAYSSVTSTAQTASRHARDLWATARTPSVHAATASPWMAYAQTIEYPSQAKADSLIQAKAALPTASPAPTSASTTLATVLATAPKASPTTITLNLATVRHASDLIANTTYTNAALKSNLPLAGYATPGNDYVLDENIPRIVIKRMTKAPKHGSLWQVANDDLQARLRERPTRKQLAQYVDEVCRLNGKLTVGEWEHLAEKDPRDPRNPNVISERQDIVLPQYVA